MIQKTLICEHYFTDNEKNGIVEIWRFLDLMFLYYYDVLFAYLNFL